MRYIPLLIACFLLVGSCKPKKEISSAEQRKRLQDYRSKRNSEKSVAGFWQEYKRTVSKKRKAEQALPFTDTLKVVFREDSTTRFYDLHGRISGGRFMYKDGLYHLGNGQSFATIEHKEDVLKLGREGRYSYLKKVEGFYTAPIALERTDEATTSNDKLDYQFLEGEWKVYKKEDEDFSNSKVYLHSFRIGETVGDGVFKVKVNHSLSTKLNRSLGELRVSDQEIQFESADYNKSFIIQKARGAEMILKDGPIVYYLKNLTK